MVVSQEDNSRMLEIDVLLGILTFAGIIIAAQTSLLVKILRRRNNNKNNKKNNPGNHIMEHLKALHVEIQNTNTEMRGLATTILKSDDDTRNVVREGNAIMVGIKALLEAHVQLHNRS